VKPAAPTGTRLPAHPHVFLGVLVTPHTQCCGRKGRLKHGGLCRSQVVQGVMVQPVGPSCTHPHLTQSGAQASANHMSGARLRQWWSTAQRYAAEEHNCCPTSMRRIDDASLALTFSVTSVPQQALCASVKLQQPSDARNWCALMRLPTREPYGLGTTGTGADLCTVVHTVSHCMQHAQQAQLMHVALVGF
jgi:hypothetical protein